MDLVEDGVLLVRAEVVGVALLPVATVLREVPALEAEDVGEVRVVVDVEAGVEEGEVAPLPGGLRPRRPLPLPSKGAL